MTENKKLKNFIKKFYQKFYYFLLKRHFYALTSPLRIFPDFIIIGAVRCGTTSLYYNICEHPCILPAAFDELGFFDSNFHLGYSWYKSMFPTIIQKKYVEYKKKNCITGEDTPFYIWNSIAAKRILKLLPNVKLIVQLRNPIDRAYSNYHVGVKYGNEKLSFEKAIEWELKKIKQEQIYEKENEIAKFNHPRSYLSKSLYAEQLKIWFELFPKENILITSTEEMLDNPVIAVNKIFQFLNVSKYDLKNPQKRKIESYPKIEPKTRKILSEFFKSHNEELYKLTGKKFNWN